VIQLILNFCSNDLGGFYLDVIKDRQYTTQENSIARRSAQTALNKWINSTRSVNRLVAITCIKHLIPFLQENTVIFLRMDILCHVQLPFTVELQIYIDISLYDLPVEKKSKHNSCLQDYSPRRVFLHRLQMVQKINLIFSENIVVQN
jgi:isoleucyl-tRNA synthetase